MAFLKWEQSL